MGFSINAADTVRRFAPNSRTEPASDLKPEQGKVTYREPNNTSALQKNESTRHTQGLQSANNGVNLRSSPGTEDTSWKNPVHIPLSDIENAKETIKEHGRDPAKAMRDLVKNHDVVIVGERHSDEHLIRKIGPDLIRAAHEAGATKLYLEVTDQSAIDTYLTTGDPSQLPALNRTKGYQKILDTAKELGMEIVAVDDDRPFHRNEAMSRNITNDLRDGEKGVLLVGSKHSIPHYVGRTNNKHSLKSIKEFLEDAQKSAAVVLGLNSKGIEDTQVGKLIAPDAATAIDPLRLPKSINNLDTDISGERGLPSPREPTQKIRDADIVILGP